MGKKLQTKQNNSLMRAGLQALHAQHAVAIVHQLQAAARKAAGGAGGMGVSLPAADASYAGSTLAGRAPLARLPARGGSRQGSRLSPAPLAPPLGLPCSSGRCCRWRSTPPGLPAAPPLPAWQTGRSCRRWGTGTWAVQQGAAQGWAGLGSMGWLAVAGAAHRDRHPPAGISHNGTATADAVPLLRHADCS